MRKRRLFLVVLALSLLIIPAGCGVTVVPDNVIRGQILIGGQAPGKALTLHVIVNQSRATLTTDAQGNYEIREIYSPDDMVSIEIGSTENFDALDAYDNDYVTWTGFESFAPGPGSVTLPALDLYSYGFGLNRPYDGEDHVAIPYYVQFNPMSRSLNNVEYALYFYGLDDVYLGSSPYYVGSSFTYDGELSDGNTLSGDAVWYPEMWHQAGRYWIYVDTWGHTAYSGSAPLALSRSLPGLQSGRRHRR